MSTLDRLYDYIDKNNIVLRYINELEKKHNVTGLYASKDDTHVILIDDCITNNKMLHESILAEECGHFATSYGNSIIPITSFNQEIRVIKEERKADKWKCDFIIPKDKLDPLLCSCNSISEIADELNTDIDIVLDRLQYLSNINHKYKVNDNLYIDLLKLPNLVKIEK